MSKKKMVYLRWLDSALVPDWSLAPNKETSRETGLSEIETIGYLVFEDKNQIQVAQSSFGDYKYSAIQSIPKSVVIKRRTIKRP